MHRVGARPPFAEELAVLACTTSRTTRDPAAPAAADAALAAAFAAAARDGNYTAAAVLAAVDAYVARNSALGPARLATGIRRSLALAVPGWTTAGVFETLSACLVRYALRDRGRAVGIVKPGA
jgi:hypothetical protein